MELCLAHGESHEKTVLDSLRGTGILDEIAEKNISLLVDSMIPEGFPTCEDPKIAIAIAELLVEAGALKVEITCVPILGADPAIVEKLLGYESLIDNLKGEKDL